MKKKLIWIGLGILTLILRYSATPELIERIYSRGLFLSIRRIFDYGVGWFPIPLLYVFYAVLIFWIIRKLIQTNWKELFTGKGILNWLLSDK